MFGVRNAPLVQISHSRLPNANTIGVLQIYGGGSGEFVVPLLTASVKDSVTEGFSTHSGRLRDLQRRPAQHRPRVTRLQSRYQRNPCTLPVVEIEPLVTDWFCQMPSVFCQSVTILVLYANRTDRSSTRHELIHSDNFIRINQIYWGHRETQHQHNSRQCFY